MIAAILFDLDGTLLDSAPDLVATLNHLRAREGLAAGRRAGSPTAFALYGYADRESQSGISDDTALINSPEEILSLLDH